MASNMVSPLCVSKRPAMSCDSKRAHFIQKTPRTPRSPRARSLRHKDGRRARIIHRLGLLRGDDLVGRQGTILQRIRFDHLHGIEDGGFGLRVHGFSFLFHFLIGGRVGRGFFEAVSRPGEGAGVRALNKNAHPNPGTDVESVVPPKLS